MKSFVLAMAIVFPFNAFSSEVTEHESFSESDINEGLTPDSLKSLENGSLKPLEERPWPGNGRVINQSQYTIYCWMGQDSGDKFFDVAPYSETPRFGMDVDYCQGPVDSEWYKISFHNFTVASNGSVSGYACKATTAGGPCK